MSDTLCCRTRSGGFQTAVVAWVARVSRVDDGVSPALAFLHDALRVRLRPKEKIVLARRQNQHARRVRYPAESKSSFWKAPLLG
jgi:hypothetical protein